ncbi:MAG TPA: MOSC domain-containing protein [Solirubrobacteraceae bacterium]|nr:MOSC domain-containing protein [Solirubrobacteraceae bacterium]
MGVVVSVNVGQIESIGVQRAIYSAIMKRPVPGRVRVRGVNLDGDDQEDRENHGGPDQAVYAYSQESYAWWRARLDGWRLAAGTFGENLTTAGVEVDHAVIGTRWRVGTALLEVTAPRIPCYKLATRMGEPRFLKWFVQARRPGAYLRIVEEGELGAGDDVELVSVPDHDVTIAMVFEAWLFDRSLLARIIEAPQLGERARAGALERLAAPRRAASA